MIRILCVLSAALMCAPLLGDDLAGTVTDADGKPLAGVRIDISTAGPKVGRGMFCPSCYLDCKKWVKSDADGNFVLKELDPTLKFHLLATAPAMATAQTGWIDPIKDKAEIKLSAAPQVDVAHQLNGQVVDAHGAPVAGALVTPYGAKAGSRRWWGQINGAMDTVTDDKGQFRMPLSADFEFLELQIVADGSSGTISQELAPGEIEHVIEVPTGAAVRGQLVHKSIPVANQSIAVVQMNRTAGVHFIKAVLSTSDAEGRFEFHNLPASQPYVIFTPRGLPSTGLCIRTSRIVVGRDDQTMDIGKLAMEQGYHLGGKLVSTDTDPLPDDLRLTLNRDPAWDLVEIAVSSDGKFAVENLPRESYTLRIVSNDWVIDQDKANYHLEGPQELAWGLRDDIDTLDIPLRRLRADELPLSRPNYDAGQADRPTTGSQSLAGIVVDRSGRPVSDIIVEPKPFDYYASKSQNWITTKHDGKFSFQGQPNQLLVVTSFSQKIKAFDAGPDGGNFIRHFGQTRAALNQKDIRIVYDPAVFMDLPDIKPDSMSKQVHEKDTPGSKP